MNAFFKSAYSIPFFLTAFLFLSACSTKGNERKALDATSALIESNKQIVAFGHVSVLGMLNKANYKAIPKVSTILGGQITTWKKAFDLDSPIYFAVEAPLAEDGTPETVFALLSVTNKDSLLDVVNEMGYSMEKEGDLNYFQENEVTFGVRNNLFIVISKKGKYDGKALIKKTFTDTEGDQSEGKTEEILSEDKDIVTGISLERIVASSKATLKLPAAKKTELEGLIADGFIQTTIAFEEGKLSVNSTNLFSEELKDRLFFKDNSGEGLIKKLGNEKAWMGISANLDMRKAEKFLSDFAPEANQKITSQMPDGAGLILMALGDKAYSSLFNGQFGLVATGNPAAAFGSVFEFNAFLGLGSQSEGIRSLIDEQLSFFPKKGDAYMMEDIAVAPRKDGVYAYTVNGKNNSKLQLPEYANDFGKNTFSMFIAFDQIDIKSLELEPSQKVMELARSLVVNTNREGTTLVLTLKSNKGNILEQVAQFYVNEFNDQISNL